MQFATGAIAQIGANLEQRIVRDFVHGFKQRRTGRDWKHVESPRRWRRHASKPDRLLFLKRFRQSDSPGCLCWRNAPLRRHDCSLLRNPLALAKTATNIMVKARPPDEVC